MVEIDNSGVELNVVYCCDIHLEVGDPLETAARLGTAPPGCNCNKHHHQRDNLRNIPHPPPSYTILPPVHDVVSLSTGRLTSSILDTASAGILNKNLHRR